MYAREGKSKGNKTKAAANSASKKKSRTKKGFGFVDNRSKATTQIKLLETEGTSDENLVKKMVLQAIEPITNEDLGKEIILEKLTEKFGSREKLHEASKLPAFAKALIQAIRLKQHGNWQSGTEIKPAKVLAPEKRRISDKVLKKFNVRHYTNKVTLIVDPKTGKVESLADPFYNELLSMITLSTLPPTTPRGKDTPTRYSYTYGAGSGASGHTTGLDWSAIGNVGDTFFALFYENELANGKKPPAFINNALFYTYWNFEQIGEIWVSSDWLSSAHHAKKGTGKPRGKAFEGAPEDVIEAALSFQARGMNDLATDDEILAKLRRALGSGNYDNFEVKVHGMKSLQNGWIQTSKFKKAYGELVDKPRPTENCFPLN